MKPGVGKRFINAPLPNRKPRGAIFGPCPKKEMSNLGGKKADTIQPFENKP